MSRLDKTLFILGLCLASAFPPTATQAAESHDVVIYGGTSAGVAAAVQVKRMGKSVIIVCPDTHLGGLSSGGLGFTDTGNKAVIGGIAREFYHRIWKHYQTDAAWKWQKRSEYGNRGQGVPAIDGAQRTMWIFEPHVAEQVFEDLVREHEIPVQRDEWLNRQTGVEKDGSRIVSITTVSGKTYRGRAFIDATYEGDLLAAAGIHYHVGREANSVYDERWNGVQKDAHHHGHYFKTPVDPYVTPGDPESGLLPLISSDPPGEDGEGDRRIQAYCFRMCLTRVPENRLPFPKPAGYDPHEYELILRVFETGWRETFNKFDPIPNDKTDTNNHGPFSTDNIGKNYDYPEASYARRREIIQQHADYQQGLMYFLANEPRVPEDVRSAMSQWGLAKDEFTDNGNWPHQIYVREARRMIGEYVMTEHDCRSTRETPKSVGMGSYSIDSHNVQRYVTADGHVQNEGDIGVSTGGPYKISYDSLVPQQADCVNLVVPVCVSSSHIAYGSIRMEPVFMILGQSAATGAVLAIDQKIPVQTVDYAELRQRLEKDGQVLEYDGPRRNVSRGIDPKRLKGIVIDNRQAKLTGNWQSSRSIGGYVGDNYVHDGNTAKGECTIEFEVEIPEDGRYEVRLAYTANPNRAKNVTVSIDSPAQKIRFGLNQQQPPKIDDRWVSLEKYKWTAGDTVRITLSNKGTDGYVVADAVQLLRR